MIFTGWEGPLRLLQMEVIQREYEGHPVPRDLKEQVAALDDEQDDMNFEAVDPFYKALEELPKDPAFPYASTTCAIVINEFSGEAFHLALARPSGDERDLAL